ncbi:response regulator transcription factor [Nonomuraea endophytica]|uniref:DNA-binding response OmpR family regulator n=1 Tax=Nonomuraea endophytica TaxID=714136 RepID=A0A7W8A9S0_9ACTN|nr:response regulator transcription factor [Nonomuraea endophytica]MBB5081186.1 DNA-binding response OmpR family regulator [Nonomuraea endophytica]
MARVLLIEDDPAVRDGLTLALKGRDHEVEAAASGEEGLDRLAEFAADVVVLDLMLPGIDGFEVCRRIRASAATSIVMLSARGDDFDVVGGLEAGADDYVVKPVRPQVLEARIRAVLRRTESVQSPVETYGALRVDRASLTVSRDGRKVALPPMELRLLLHLSATPGRVFNRQQLLESVWEHDYLGDSRLVDACVQRLRAKIEDVPAEPRYVQTVRGFGYRFGPV